MQASTPKQPGSMDANDDDPMIGIHVLSQFVYCPRAGVCAHETRQCDLDEEPLPANLVDLPQYELSQIEEGFARAKSQLLIVVGAVMFVAALGFYVTARFAPPFVWLLVAFLILSLWPIYWSGVPVWVLSRRAAAFRNAVAREPDAEADEIQTANWFEMLRAGFMSIDYHRLTHERWKVCGRPWRVLRRGNLRIPVFFQVGADQNLHPKHLAKVAAYCHLFQAVETCESPYALILKENSFEAYAVPNNPRSRKIFHDALRLARRTIREQAARVQPAAPSQVSLCSGCPFGLPERFMPGETDEVQTRISLEVFLVSDQEGNTYHSFCGDRFRWLPRHAQTLQRDLFTV